MSRSVFLLLLAFAGAAGGYAREDEAVLELVPGAVEVVSAADAAPAVRFAADELAHFLGEALGAPVPVVAAADGRRTALGFRQDASLPRDAFRIETTVRGVTFVGRDDPSADIRALVAKEDIRSLQCHRSSLFAVYEFLERFAGARFYFPGELGTCVPRCPRIRIPLGTVRSQPAFTVRHYYANGDGKGFEGGSKALNWLRTRMQTYRVPCCHGQNAFRIMERFAKERPDYLRLDDKGVRNDRVVSDRELGGGTGWKYHQLCQSSGIWDVFFDDTMDYFRNGRRSKYAAFRDDYVDVMPHDGYKRCFCERCRKAYVRKDDPNYATELIWGRTVEFANRLKAAGSPAIVTMMAYAPYARVPDFAIPDNVRVMVAEHGPWSVTTPDEFDRQIRDVRDWSEKVGGGRSVWVWTYPFKTGGLPDIPQMGPRAYARYYAALMPIAFGAFAESDSDKWIYNYLNYYIFGKVAWNGSVDVERELDEHHRLMFGAAAPEMRKFYDGLEEKWVDGVCGKGVTPGPLGPVPLPVSEPELWLDLYGDKTMREWSAFFDVALAKVAPGSLEARRLGFIRREFLDPLKAKSAAATEAHSVRREQERRAVRRPANLVRNGDFASLDGWTADAGAVALDVREFVSAPSSLRISSSDAAFDGPYIRAAATRMLDREPERMKPSVRYRLSFFVKCRDVKPIRRDAGVTLCFHDNMDHALPLPLLTGDCDWVHFSVEFTSKKNTNIATMAFLRPRLTNATGTAWFDDILLEEVP